MDSRGSTVTRRGARRSMLTVGRDMVRTLNWRKRLKRRGGEGKREEDSSEQQEKRLICLG